MRNGTLLNSVPPGVATWTVPVVAPAGTVVVISDGETTAERLSHSLAAFPKYPVPEF